MKAYLDLLRHVLDHGERRKNRTGVDTIGVFGRCGEGAVVPCKREALRRSPEGKIGP